MNGDVGIVNMILEDDDVTILQYCQKEMVKETFFRNLMKI